MHTGPELRAELSQQLGGGGYRPGLIRRVWIPKASGGQRGLGIPNVVDRVVQEAVRLEIDPLYEPTFHASSHGFRKGRSCHTALAQARQYEEEGHEFVVDLDLEKFFDRVPHQRLMATLSLRIHDRDVLALIGRMLRAGVVLPDGVHRDGERVPPRLDGLLRDLHRVGPRAAADDGRAHPATAARARPQGLEAQTYDRAEADRPRSEAEDSVAQHLRGAQIPVVDEHRGRRGTGTSQRVLRRARASSPWSNCGKPTRDEPWPRCSSRCRWDRTRSRTGRPTG